MVARDRDIHQTVMKGVRRNLSETWLCRDGEVSEISRIPCMTIIAIGLGSFVGMFVIHSGQYQSGS